jgi:hypothetical protein
MTNITNLQAQIDNAKAEMAQKVVRYLQAQTVPVNTKSAYVGSQFKVSVVQVLEATGVNAADLLTAMRNDTLDKALHAIDWHVGTTGVGDPEGRTGCYHRRATAGLEGFEFWQWTKFDLSVEDAINIILAGDEAFEREDDDDDCEAFDRHHERLAAAESIVYDYLIKLTTKWTARDVKLARIYIERLAESHEDDCKPRDFIPHIETLTELNEALLRGLEAAAA